MTREYPIVWMLAAAMFSGGAIFETAAAEETLQDAWNAAVAADHQLEAARWQASAAQRGLAAAQSERLPALKATAGYYVMNNPLGVVAPMPAPLGDVTMNVLQREAMIAGAQISQPVYTFGRIQSGIDAACAEVNAAAANQTAGELDVLFRVATAYLNVLRTERAVDVAEQSVESLESHVSDVTNLVNTGVAVMNDQLAAEVSLANARQNLMQVQAQLNMAQAAYNRALGRPLDSPVQLADLAEPTGEYDLAQLTEEALATRPELNALGWKAQSMRSQAAGVRAGKLPQFQVQGGVYHLEDRYLSHETFSGAMLMGSWNLFDSGRTRHNAAKLEQNAEAIAHRQSDLESVIRLQVRDAWTDLETTRKRVAVTRKAMASADENLRVAKTRYDQGAGTNTEVLNAETLRTTTYNNFHSSRYDAIQALMRLSRAIGHFGLVSDAMSTVYTVSDEGDAASVPSPPAP